MNFWTLRVDPIGSPFRNVNSGVSDYDDHINRLRLDNQTAKYLEKFSGKFFILSLEENDLPKVNWNSYQKALFYPAAIAPVVYAFQRAYTRPSSHYIRKIGLVFAILGGFQIGARSDRRDYNIFLMNNYQKFSPQFKLALSTGDARYLGE